MSLAVLHSRALSGLDAPEVTGEGHLGSGLPSFPIVGLPDTEVKESRDRVRAALVNSRFEFPARRITVNLAPAELPKESGRFDLPIALGILAASRQLEVDGFSKYEFAGELSLTGELRPVRGALAMTWRAARGARRPGVCPAAGERGSSRTGRRSPRLPGRLAAGGLCPPCRPAAAAAADCETARHPAELPGPRGCERPGATEARARSRCGRRSQRTHDRAPRNGKIDAGGALRGLAAADEQRGSTRICSACLARLRRLSACNLEAKPVSRDALLSLQ